MCSNEHFFDDQYGKMKLLCCIVISVLQLVNVLNAY